MANKLSLQVCRNYFPEVQAAMQQEQFKNVTVCVFQPVCKNPQAQLNVLDLMTKKMSLDEDQILLAGGCVLLKEMDLPSSFIQTASLAEIYKLNNCLHMFANPDLVDYFFKDGSYHFTSGWLSFWRTNLEEWGFDQATARSFFQESITRLVLFETIVDPNSSKKLAEFSEYVGLPTQVIPIGLDYFRLLLSKVVLEWQIKQIQANSISADNEARQLLANYSLAFDLLANLTKIRIEADAFNEILNIFSMLFAPEEKAYILFDESMHQTSIPSESTQNLYQWAMTSDESYRWLEDKKGFFLRIAYQSATIGVVKINQVAFPQYIQQYLNMCLDIAPLFGLIISNARAYQKLEEKEQMLLNLAITDSLTGLFNRRHFLELAEVEYHRAKRYHHPLSVIAIDIDYFKEINDTYGHAAGDQVLIEFSKKIFRMIRQSDVCARIGGDEFQILLPETPLTEAHALAKRLCKSISEIIIQLESATITITGSFGVAGIDENSASLNDLLHQSDVALYKAKENGRNQAAF